MLRKMKKVRFVAMLITASLLVTLTGCDGSTGAATSSTTNPSTTVTTPVETVEATPTPEEVAKPTEEPVEVNPTEEAVPTEEPVVEVDPMQEYDFTPYNEWQKSETYFNKIMEFDSLRWVAVWVNVDEHKKEVFSILKDGDSVEEVDSSLFYNYYLYVPKKIVSASSVGNKDFQTKIMDSSGVVLGNVDFELASCDNLEATVEVTYEDGTSETITIYITR